MKRHYILLVWFILFSLNLNAASLNSFTIQGQYLVGSNLKVSMSNPTEFKVDYSITRYLKDYGYENINWIVTVVYQKNGEAEIELTTPLTLTESTLVNPINYRTATATIPAGKVGGRVSLKFQSLMYNASGTPVNNLRITEYSSTSYITATGSVVPEVPVIPPAPFNSINAHLFTTYPTDGIRRIDYISGGFHNVESNWANTQGMAHLNGYIYIVQSGNLHKVNPISGSYNLIGESGIWNGTEAVASSSNGYIYIVQNSTLHKVDPNTGNYSILGIPDWAGTEGMVAYNGYLYIVQNSTLHKVDENTGTYSILGIPDWSGTEAIASSGDGFIYLVQNGYLHKVSTTDGSYVILGDREWLNTYKMGMAYYNGFLYILQNDRLHKVNKEDGSYTILGNPSFSQNKFLTAY